ncbi:hypothetical protein BDQ17DRAFT_1367226, partial [Cyathus striatus]
HLTSFPQQPPCSRSLLCLLIPLYCFFSFPPPFAFLPSRPFVAFPVPLLLLFIPPPTSIFFSSLLLTQANLVYPQ